MAKEINGRVWKLTMLIIAGLATLALYLAGLGYNSIDRRLSSIEQDFKENQVKIAQIDACQQERLRRETIEKYKMIR